MKLIGKGTFTKAYLMNDGETVKLITNDPCKECLAIGLGPDSPLFPKIEQDGWEGDNRVYKMKYYPRNSSLKKSLKAEHYELYKHLRKVFFSLFFAQDFHLTKFVDKVNEILPDTFTNEKQAIIEYVDGLNNYGEDMRFEISPRNVAVDNGNLILLDCFFKKSLLPWAKKV
jgi:hypothetical protein